MVWVVRNLANGHIKISTVPFNIRGSDDGEPLAIVMHFTIHYWSEHVERNMLFSKYSTWVWTQLQIPLRWPFLDHFSAIHFMLISRFARLPVTRTEHFQVQIFDSTISLITQPTEALSALSGNFQGIYILIRPLLGFHFIHTITHSLNLLFNFNRNRVGNSVIIIIIIPEVMNKENSVSFHGSDPYLSFSWARPSSTALWADYINMDGVETKGHESTIIKPFCEPHIVCKHFS